MHPVSALRLLSSKQIHPVDYHKPKAQKSIIYLIETIGLQKGERDLPFEQVEGTGNVEEDRREVVEEGDAVDSEVPLEKHPLIVQNVNQRV